MRSSARFPRNGLVEEERRKKYCRSDAVVVNNFGNNDILSSNPEILALVPSVFYCTCRISNPFFIKKKTCVSILAVPPIKHMCRAVTQE